MVILFGFLKLSTPTFSLFLYNQNMEDDDGKKHIGTGGMADTRDPEPKDDPDPRKSISAAPSFEEYLKQKQAEGK